MCNMKIWDTVLTLALLANCISRCPGFFFMNRKFKGQLKPVDPDVCTRQNITFTSELLQSPVLNSSIGFAIKTKHTNGKYVTVEYDRIVEVNETMSQFTMYNITLGTEEAAKPVYFFVSSYYWQEFGDIDGELQFGEISAARIFPLPEQVRDFKCIVMNYESMNCTWNYGIDYRENMPEVIFQWRIPLYAASWTNCKDLSIENGYCYWRDVTAEYFKNSNLTMRITLKQKCGISAATEFQIDTAKIVKPNPVSNISSKAINSTCVQLLWDTTDSEPQHPKQYRVIVSSEGDTVTTKFIFTTSGTEMLNEVICNLRPYTKYTFSVSMRPIDSEYFSDERKGVSMTYSDIPSASPEVTEGGYKWNHRDCEGKGQKRRVCIFWKPIKNEHKNGPMNGVQALLTTVDAKRLHFQEDWAEDSTYGCSSLLCNTSYYYTVKARNVNGSSENGSTIKIPKFIPGLKPTEIAGISVAVLVCAIFAGVGLFCVVRICKMKAKKVIQEAGHITIPDFPDLDNFTELRHLNSNDSGYDLTPPPENISNETNFGLVQPDDYRYATNDHGKTNNDNDETSISSGETTIGNGDHKLTTTEAYIPEPEKIHLITNQPDISVLPTVTSQNRRESKLMLVIPKPVAFNKTSENWMSYSGEDNNITTDTLKDKLVDCIKCKNAYSDSIDIKQNDLPTKGTMINNDSETNDAVADKDSKLLKHEMHQANLDSPFHLSNVQSLIKIPCPNKVGISYDAFTGDDNETSLTDSTNKGQQYRHIASPLSIVINSEIKYTKDYIAHSNAVQANAVPDSNAVQDSVVRHSNFVQENVVLHSNAVQDNVVPHSNAVQDNVVPHSNAVHYNAVQENVILHSNAVKDNVVPHSKAVQDTVVPHSNAVQNNTILHSNADQDNIVPHSYAVQDNIATHSNAVQNNVVSHSDVVRGNVVSHSNAVQDSAVPHSNAVQNNVVCCNASFSNITNFSNKCNGYVPHANIITDCMPSYAVQIYIPSDKMGTIVDHGSHIDSHTIPTTRTFQKNVDPGYVFSTEGNGVCKDLEIKIPLDVGYVEQENSPSKNIDDKDFVSFQGYVDDRLITSLQTETLNVAKSADIEGETNSRCIPINKDGYVAHSILKEENDK